MTYFLKLLLLCLIRLEIDKHLFYKIRIQGRNFISPVNHYITNNFHC